MLRTRSRQTAILVVALTAVVGFALPALGDGPLPFKGYAEEMRISARPCGDSLVVTVSGTGLASHLGRFTRVASITIGADGTPEGLVVFTAADGDQLFATVESTRISPTTVIGTYTFTGGTGRFTDVSGTADFEGFSSDGGAHIRVTFEGTIQY
jgi:hypothetical protein